MAVVYILYSSSLDKFYTGSCEDFQERIRQHENGYFPQVSSGIYPESKWLMIYLLLENLSYLQARNIEAHIKKMKSRRFLENLKKYPEMLNGLADKYKMEM